MDSPVKKAIDKAGSQSALARSLNITPQAVQRWVSNDRVPHMQVINIEKITGISRHELRPDLYPVD